mgnify:CR=1 FL=1
MSRQTGNQSLLDTSFLEGTNAPYLEEMHERYARDPASVSEDWRAFFDSLRDDTAAITKEASGPSWVRPHWTPASNSPSRPTPRSATTDRPPTPTVTRPPTSSSGTPTSRTLRSSRRSGEARDARPAGSGGDGERHSGRRQSDRPTGRGGPGRRRRVLACSEVALPARARASEIRWRRRSERSRRRRTAAVARGCATVRTRRCRRS